MQQQQQQDKPQRQHWQMMPYALAARDLWAKGAAAMPWELLAPVSVSNTHSTRPASHHLNAAHVPWTDVTNSFSLQGTLTC